MPKRPRTRALNAGGAAVLLLLAGCSAGAEPPRARSQDRDVSFSSCAQVECAGEIDGAAFQILMPEQWNGTLLLWSHGIRAPEPTPLDPEAPVNTAAEPAPGWSEGDPGDVAQPLLDAGFALAGSAYRSNGWAVTDAVADQTALYEYFVDNVGDPDRTIAWGASLGGLVTAMLAEEQAEWIDGVAPLCGVLAGGVDNLDVALDVTYGLRELLVPDLQLTGYDDWAAAAAEWQKAYDAVLEAGSDVERGVPTVLLLAAISDAQSQTKTYDGSTVESQVRAYGEGVVNALTYGTLFRSDIESRVGGNPSDNTGTDYALRIDDTERSLIDTVGGKGTTDRLLAELAGGERVVADEAARAELAEGSTPVGAVTDPTFTLHTRADPLVIAQNSTVYGERTSSNPDRTADLVQAFTVAPAAYEEVPGAPYGAGHCNFTSDTYVGVAELMDSWVRGGLLPTPAAIGSALGDDSGYSSAYSAGPWPADLG